LARRATVVGGASAKSSNFEQKKNHSFARRDASRARGMTSERAATAATSSRGRPVYVHAAPLLCRACAQIIAPNPPVTCAGGAACSWPRYFHERCLSDDLKVQEARGRRLTRARTMM